MCPDERGNLWWEWPYKRGNYFIYIFSETTEFIVGYLNGITRMFLCPIKIQHVYCANYSFSMEILNTNNKL